VRIKHEDKARAAGRRSTKENSMIVSNNEESTPERWKAVLFEKSA
jgi:hypothetical protein